MIIKINIFLFSLAIYGSLCFAQGTTSSGHASRPQGPLETSQETAEKGSTITIPFGYYTPETRIAGGFLLIKNFKKEATGRTNSIVSSASVTVLGQSIFNIAPRFYFNQGEYELGGLLFYSYFPSKFYGLGLNGTLSEPEDFLENTLLSNVNGGVRLKDHYYLRGAINFEKRKSQNFEAGGRFDQDVIYKDLSTLIYTLSFEDDERDYPQSPTQGHLYRISASWYNPKDNQENKNLSSFEKYEIELRKYIPLEEQKVLALQLLGSEVHSEEYVPFQYLNSIGGSSRLRGYYNGRYRGKALGLLQAEYRWEWRDRWVAAAFIGTAKLSEKAEALFKDDESRAFTSGGFGIHYIVDPANRTKFRLDIGLGAEKLGVYVIIGEAF